MIIDQYFEQPDKSNFYLGMVSQVYRENAYVQVENLSLLNHRNILIEQLVPNTINYFVVIDSVQGLFIGQIYQSKVNSSDSVHESMNSGRKEEVYPEIAVDVIGLLQDNNFKLAGFKTVGITDKVYIANQKLIEKYLESIEINDYEGQSAFENLARLANFDDRFLSLQPNTIFDRHLMAIGTTNSGKSTSALSILDKMISSRKKVLIIDPTGEYRDSFSKDEVKKLNLGIDTILPIGKVTLPQWSMIFQTNDGSQDTELMKAIRSLRFQEKQGVKEVYVKDGRTLTDVQNDLVTIPQKNNDSSFCLNLLPEQIIAESVTEGTKQNTGKYVSDSFRSGVNTWLAEKVQNVLDNSEFDLFFGSDTNKEDLLTEIDGFISSDIQSLYIDSSNIGTNDGIGGMVIDLISNHIINKEREEIKPFVMYIDEVHRYTQNVEKYSSGLISIVREGRKKGIFLFLTTQNPKDVPDVLLGQIGTMIIHRITHSEELKAIKNHVHENTLAQISKLNQGEAILSSINLLKDVQVSFEKSNRKHDNDTPIL